MILIQANVNDISALYALQKLAFKSEAAMIGSRGVPALQESPEEFQQDFSNWTTFKLADETERLIGAIRFRKTEGGLEVGRLMIHPDWRRKGLAKRLLQAVDELYPHESKVLYTCTKSWLNIRLYKKMGYLPFRKVHESSGLDLVWMRKSGD